MNGTWFKLAQKGQEQRSHPYLILLFNCQCDLDMMDD